MLLNCLTATKRTGCERKPTLSKRWAEIQCSLPKNQNTRSVHTCLAHFSLPEISWIMKWPWSTAPRESRSALTLSCAWRHSTARKGSTYLRIAPSPTLSMVWAQHYKNTYFVSSVLLGYWQSSSSEGVRDPPPVLEYKEWAITHCGTDTASASVTQLGWPP